MAVEHQLADYETLQSLALKYLGDASKWKEIADYNKLDYPYIVTDSDEVKDYFGSGYITIVRNTLNDTIVKKGWHFKTKPNIFVGGIVKYFEVTEDTEIPAGAPAWQVPCRCTVPGGFGNVIEYSITEADSDTLANSDIGFVAIYNDQKFTNGRDFNIRITGDIIYIPTDSTEVIPEDVSKMLALTSGSDLLLDDGGDLVFNTAGDLASVDGADNIKYAVASRLATELGDLTLHPEYGTDTQSIVGTPNLANNEKLVKVAILRALANDDRITNVKVDIVQVVGTAIYAEVSYNVANTNIVDSVQLYK